MVDAVLLQAGTSPECNASQAAVCGKRRPEAARRDPRRLLVAIIALKP